MIRARGVLTGALVVAALVGCGGGGDGVDELPLDGGGDSPVVSDLWSNCWSQGISTYAVVGDPQGAADVLAVSVTILDDLSEEPVGTLRLSPCEDCAGNFSNFRYDDDDELGAILPSICSSPTWPVEVVATDQAGHETRGRIDISITL